MMSLSLASSVGGGSQTVAVIASEESSDPVWDDSAVWDDSDTWEDQAETP